MAGINGIKPGDMSEGKLPNSLEYRSRNGNLRLTVEGPVHLLRDPHPITTEGDWKLSFFWHQTKPLKPLKKKIPPQVFGANGRITKFSWGVRRAVIQTDDGPKTIVHPNSPIIEQITQYKRVRMKSIIMREFVTMRGFFDHPAIYDSIRAQLSHALEHWEADAPL
ncbi:MAG TPA: hypothetical protein VJI13_04800 [Candidatus Norongarragalinales archaeon]|nr:hypothetical protein [Candidatus Norongarragalinales archaeon]